MGVLEKLEPRDVFYFFEEICKIPHGSGNTERIGSYLEEFAHKRGLEHGRDEIGNVIIIKEASAGYEDHPPVMLQGHMDMVTVGKPGCMRDLKKDGLKIMAESDRIYAQDTSLGADDGIAIAYGLALLDGTKYKHPRIELVFTVDEEAGMNGARELDVSALRAKRMINLDSEEEGIFLAGCAGGARVDLALSGKMDKRRGLVCEVKVEGLQGGHSGTEIHRERGNAICLLGRMLHGFAGKMDFCIADLYGGVADNAIPVFAGAKLVVTGYGKEKGWRKMAEDDFSIRECAALLKKKAEKLNCQLREELAQKDPHVKIEVAVLQHGSVLAMQEADSKRITEFLNLLPYGVQAMSFAMPGLVETSLNPGTLSMKEGIVKVGISVRSSLESAKQALLGKLRSFSMLAGAGMEISGEYPGWAYQKDSPLRDKMAEVYRELYGKEPAVEAIHAGVECGLLIHKIPGLDCVSIGPDMKNIHTTEEELSISSAARVWYYLIKLLERL